MDPSPRWPNTARVTVGVLAAVAAIGAGFAGWLWVTGSPGPADACQFVETEQNLAAIETVLFDALEEEGYDLDPDRQRETAVNRRVLRNWEELHALDLRELADASLALLSSVQLAQLAGSPGAQAIEPHLRERAEFRTRAANQAASDYTGDRGPYSRGDSVNREAPNADAQRLFVAFRDAECPHLIDDEAEPSTTSTTQGA